jgi:hypothetical protein
MPLSKPNPRNQIHNRKIEARGFQRDDGLWDIESRLIDTKTYSFDNTDRGMINSGEAIHDISIRITIDDDMTVQSAEAVIDSGPFTLCGDITPAFKALEGLSVKPGWRKSVLQRLGGTKGCTHIVDMLLGPIAVTSWQTVNPARQKRNAPSGGGKPPLLNSCHAFSAASRVVKREWPDYYVPED